MDLSGKLTVIVPCYNEALALPHVLPALIDIADQNSWQVICINDGSTDDTLKVLKDYEKYITVINHKVNRGYGGAIKSGILDSKTDYVITIDADGQHYLEDIEKLFTRLLSSDADMVIGSRKGLKSASHFRGLGKAIIRRVARLLVGVNIYDINSGMKLYRTDLAKKYSSLLPDTMAFSDIIAMVFINQKHRVLEEPIKIRARIAGASTIGLHTAFLTVGELINIVTFFNPMRVFLPVSLFFGSVGVLWGSWILLQGKGLSVGASFLIIMSVLTFLIGLLSEQITKVRKQIIELHINR